MTDETGPRVPNKLRSFDREARKLGYRLTRRCGSGHLMYQHISHGATVTVAGTASDWRAQRNNLSRMRRYNAAASTGW